ncbi:MAG TPA: hypothetical protein VGK33_23225, partial [Chloroflexota bacterium]
MSAEPDLRSAAGGGLNGPARRRSWPRKNTSEQIQERQDLLRGLPNWSDANDFVFNWPTPPSGLAGVLEALTAHMVLPVSVVGPLRLTLGA